MFTVTQLPI